MKLALWPMLGKVRLQESALDLGLESVVDVKGENSFLRKLVLLLAFVALGEAAALLIKARAPRPSLPVTESIEVSYAEEVERSSATTAGVLSLAPAMNPPDAGGTPQAAADPPKARRRVLAAKAAQETVAPKPALKVSTPAARPIEPSFWDLLKQVQNDPEREIIDRTFSANGLAVHLKEIAKPGILHFELENVSKRPVYLPKIAVPGSKTRAYLERQVLEAETSQQGLLVFEVGKHSGALEAIVSAANIAPFKIRIELPHWSKP